MKTYKKGRKAELEYKKMHENYGYQVIMAPKGNKFTKIKDFAGSWDIIAYSKESWLVAQIKCNTTGGQLKKLKEKAKELPEGTEAHLAIRIDGRGRKKALWRFLNLRED